MSKEVNEREKLELKCRMTISYHFGMICDEVDRYMDLQKISSDDADKLKKVVRKNGNNAIRVIEGHLSFHKIARNHAADKPNTRNIVDQAMRELKG